MGIVQSASCTETRPGSRRQRRVPNKSRSRWSAAPGPRRPGSRVCPSASRRHGYRGELHSHQGQAERGESYRKATTVQRLVLSLSSIICSTVVAACGAVTTVFSSVSVVF